MIISHKKAAEAAVVMELELDQLTSAKLKKAYRDKAKLCHPDKVGTGKMQEWARVGWAYSCLTYWLEQHPVQDIEPSSITEIQTTGDCRACAGSGRVKVRGGTSFRQSLTMQCVMCRGLGTLIPEENDSD